MSVMSVQALIGYTCRRNQDVRILEVSTPLYLPLRLAPCHQRSRCVETHWTMMKLALGRMTTIYPCGTQLRLRKNRWFHLRNRLPRRRANHGRPLLFAPRRQVITPFRITRLLVSPIRLHDRILVTPVAVLDPLAEIVCCLGLGLDLALLIDLALRLTSSLLPVYIPRPLLVDLASAPLALTRLLDACAPLLPDATFHLINSFDHLLVRDGLPPMQGRFDWGA